MGQTKPIHNNAKHDVAQSRFIFSYIYSSVGRIDAHMYSSVGRIDAHVYIYIHLGSVMMIWFNRIKSRYTIIFGKPCVGCLCIFVYIYIYGVRLHFSISECSRGASKSLRDSTHYVCLWWYDIDEMDARLWNNGARMRMRTRLPVACKCEKPFQIYETKKMKMNKKKKHHVVEACSRQYCVYEKIHNAKYANTRKALSALSTGRFLYSGISRTQRGGWRVVGWKEWVGRVKDQASHIFQTLVLTKYRNIRLLFGMHKYIHVYIYYNSKIRN